MRRGGERPLWLVALALALALCRAQAAPSPTPAATRAEAVLLASTANYPDAMAARPASVRLGIPLLLTGRDALSGDARAALDELGPRTAYVVGGPSVVGEGVAAELASMGVEVVRLWGMERAGTSAAVAERLWPEGSAEAVLVADAVGPPEAGNVVEASAAKDLAAARGAPLLFVAADGVPAAAAGALSRLNATRVRLVGSRVQDPLRMEIASLGLALELVDGSTPAEAAAVAAMRVAGMAQAAGGRLEELVVSAGGSAADALEGVAAEPTGTRSASLVVRTEADISYLAGRLNELAPARVSVVGRPDLAERAAAAFAEAGYPANRTSGTPEGRALGRARLDGAKLAAARAGQRAGGQRSLLRSRARQAVDRARGAARALAEARRLALGEAVAARRLEEGADALTEDGLAALDAEVGSELASAEGLEREAERAVSRAESELSRGNLEAAVSAAAEAEERSRMGLYRLRRAVSGGWDALLASDVLSRAAMLRRAQAALAPLGSRVVPLRSRLRSRGLAGTEAEGALERAASRAAAAAETAAEGDGEGAYTGAVAAQALLDALERHLGRAERGLVERRRGGAAQAAGPGKG